MKPLLVIDADPGTDDAVAFVVSTLLGDGFDRVSVSTYGNTSLDVTHANLRKVLSLTGIKCTLIRGSEASLAGKVPDCGGYHGADGLGGAGAMIDDTFDGEEGTLDDLAEMVCAAESCTYLAIGPLTNLARMLRARPEVAGHIERLLIMGGGFEKSNRPHAAEYNFAADPIADAEVFASGIPITLFPLDLTHRYPLTPKRIAGLSLKEGSPLKMILEANCRSGMRYGDAGAIIHDAFTVLHVLHPEAFELVKTRVSVDGWGRTVFDETGTDINVAVFAKKGLLAKALAKAIARKKQT